MSILMDVDGAKKDRNLGTIIISEMFEEKEVSSDEAKMEAMKVFIASVHSREIERAMTALSDFISLCE